MDSAGLGKGGWERNYSLLRKSSLRTTVVTCTKATLWFRDPRLAQVPNGHQNRFGKHVSFSETYSEMPWGIKLVKDWTS